MIADALLTALGIGLLIAGGEFVVRGAMALARQLGVPPLVIGLTVVAFGTSVPELAVNVTAALRGNTGIALGNVVGSNLANVGLILAIAALLRRLEIRSVVITRELPMLLLASVAATVMAFDGLRAESDAVYDRIDGILLLLLFAIVLYYTVLETFRNRSADPLVEQAREQAGRRLSPLAGSAAFIGGGLCGLALGGNLTVSGAVGLATSLGASPGLIGLTVVAVGTSLPELSASVMAARHGETDLAVGNVVGSNLFNLLFILGVTAVIRPVPVLSGGHVDICVMTLFALALLAVSLGRRALGRAEAAVLVAGYLGYLAWRVS